MRVLPVGQLINELHELAVLKGKDVYGNQVFVEIRVGDYFYRGPAESLELMFLETGPSLIIRAPNGEGL